MFITLHIMGYEMEEGRKEGRVVQKFPRAIIMLDSFSRLHKIFFLKSDARRKINGLL